ncbi:DUF2752 domain-containing protein [Epilithonimonas xixisoli]|uniref:Uncharacterized protein DUF2752 n=1 Tax=Epilithonimonas xixisoli TaxID=1476462 RepID=A0A4R8I8H7_9FLAO|nr:DUF2752 domain-containing protein [Epilithonimonas xixisoli]TDX86348.1 uncharacterized protein DUF2752 [Epilithonimonas xixisoli]
MNLTQKNHKNQELKNAIKIVWQISGVLSILILLILFFVDENLILSKMPTCEYQKIGKECFLCGSTRAFIEIKNMNFEKAWSLNKFSFFIFGALFINAILCLKTIIKKYINTKL